MIMSHHLKSDAADFDEGAVKQGLPLGMPASFEPKRLASRNS